jgi:hypothetical protein
MSLPNVAPCDDVSNVLWSSDCRTTYVITLHHCEVVAAHDSVFELLLREKLSPTVIVKDSTVVKEPLHRSWVLSLTWWWARVLRVGAHTVSAPDSKNGWRDLRVHRDRVVVLQVLDGRSEVRQEP